ncbi:MAG: hypothetical protein PHG25_01850 [Candidatus Pacebacteria bacterium]|nr:hypothetical protein [Candidatus Paceibacterota bacterium]
MTNKQLLDYISYKLAHGSSAEAVQQKLIAEGGWSAVDIKEAFIALGHSVVTSQTPTATISPKVFVPTTPAPVIPVVSVPVSTPVIAPKPQFTAPPIAPKPPIEIKITPTPISTPKPPVSSVSQYPSNPVQTSQPIASFPKPPPATFAQQYQTSPIPTPPRTFTPPPSFSSMPQTVASKAFVVPQQSSSPRRSGILILIFVFIICAFVGAGAYVYFFQPNLVQSVTDRFTKKTSQVPVVNTQVSPLKSKSSIVDNALYSFTLPRGWKPSVTSNGGQGVQASSSASGYIMCVAITPIPDTSGLIDSVDQIITSENVDTIIKSEFAGAVLGKVSSSTLSGEKAVVIAFTVSSTGSDQSAREAILQYSAVHGGTLYSVVFKSSLDRGLSLIKDAESIVSSFTFK